MVTLKKLFFVINFIILLGLAFSFMTQLSYATESPLTAQTPTRLVIPAINLDSPIIPTGYQIIQINEQYYTQWLVDDNWVGWQNLSAAIGQPGNTVFNGHSNIGGMVFQHLPEVQVGNIITVYVGEQPYDYVITQIVIVQEKGVSLEQRVVNAQWIMPTLDERLTLVTCLYPEATHRLIVVATPISSTVTQSPYTNTVPMTP